MTVALIIIGIIVIFGLVFVGMYNGFVKDKNHIEEAWSGIDVQLKRRHNLIPALISTVKGITNHEESVFKEIAELRAKSLGAGPSKDKEALEFGITGSLKSILALSENYPELKSNQNFLDIQQQLSEIEDDIHKSRRYYNGTVRSFNIKVETFPSLIIAKMFGFVTFDYFELKFESQRAMPEVSFEK